MRSFNLYQRAFLEIVRSPEAHSHSFIATTSAHSLEAVFTQFQAEVRP